MTSQRVMLQDILFLVVTPENWSALDHALDTYIYATAVHQCQRYGVQAIRLYRYDTSQVASVCAI